MELELSMTKLRAEEVSLRDSLSKLGALNESLAQDKLELNRLVARVCCAPWAHLWPPVLLAQETSLRHRGPHTLCLSALESASPVSQSLSLIVFFHIQRSKVCEPCFSSLVPHTQGCCPFLCGGAGWACSLGGWRRHSWSWEGPPAHPHLPHLQLEEEKAALLGRQQQAEHEATLALEEQERLEQLRLEQEVERQSLEGSLHVAEQAREALEQQLPTLRRERSQLQEQLAQVG